MGERDDARRSIEDARERMSAIAEEMSRRASPGYVKDRAREVAVRKTSEFRERASSSSATWGLLGGLLGATAGAAAGKGVRRRAEIQGSGDLWEPQVKTYEYGYSSPSGYNPETSPYGAAPVSGVSEYGVGFETGGEGWAGGPQAGYPPAPATRAEVAREHARERASTLGRRASGKAGEWRQRARERSAILRERSHQARERIPDLRGQASDAYQHGVDDRPLALALGAIGLGLAAALLFPLTQRERQLLGPTRGRMRRRLDDIERRFESQIGGSSSTRAAPSASSAPYFGEDAGVVEETSETGGSTEFFEPSFTESTEKGGDRTLH